MHMNACLDLAFMVMFWFLKFCYMCVISVDMTVVFLEAGRRCQITQAWNYRQFKAAIYGC